MPSCEWCTNLHGNLARIAGVSNPLLFVESTSVEQTCKLSTSSAVRYARIYAETNGEPTPELTAAYKEVEKFYSPSEARSVKTQCLFLLWGKTTGDSISRARKSPLSQPLHTHILHLYYTPLFGLVTLTSTLLSFLPPLPDVFGKVMGVVLTGLIGVHVAPLGVFRLFF